ncbi:hypothetical protein PHMEG_00012457 [Phytophthora megakarya]|uniref:Uncharacterized protein n=1 Tax=Phytophthora megakarya TaxID=4795 RepID=A0A225WAR6_9STRA|nr:hypothetical protein PHMEG_00012457 [Phytophthora megakarya]
MITALLNMRFQDDQVKKRVERADTNRKKALAWQFFASRLSDELNVVVSSEQVCGISPLMLSNLTMLQGVIARSHTGNEGQEDDSELWGILTSAFGGRTGIGGTTIADGDTVSDETDEELSFDSQENRQRTSITPIASLAEAMKDGMSAIAASLGPDDKLVDVLQELRASQVTSQDLQRQQLILLQQLVMKINSSD